MVKLYEPAYDYDTGVRMDEYKHGQWVDADDYNELLNALTDLVTHVTFGQIFDDELANRVGKLVN